MVLVLIAVDGRPLWVSLLVYATVTITVLSGADYFFGFRRYLGQRAPGGGKSSAGARSNG